MVLANIVFFLLVFSISSTYAVINIVGGTPAEQLVVNAAIDEAVTVANDVLAKLEIYTGENENYVDAALKPLFDAADLNQVGRVYLDISRVRSSPAQITFYLDEDHIVVNSKGSWADQGFTYTRRQGDVVHLKVPINKYPPDKPGVVGSYTVLGFKINDEQDFSDQFHIFISQKRLHPTSNQFDTRSFAEIRMRGLSPDHNFLDAIKPLSETVIHELMHVVGGVLLPNRGDPKISDGPSVYGYTKSVYHKQNALAVAINPMVRLADPLMLVGKMLYLQIDNPQNAPTWWVTGEVDPATLQPLDLPPSAKRRRRFSL